MLQRHEAGTHRYSRLADNERIWAGVMYIYGVDTQEAPGNSLYSDSDICNAMASMMGGADASVAQRQGLDT